MDRISLPPLSLVFGAAASGKSDFAETLVRRSGLKRVYLATSEAQDAEMRAKIARHVARRGAGWEAIEAPRDLGPALRERCADQVVLLDCATMWLSNQIMTEADLVQAEADLLRDLAACSAPCVVVSNELGAGIVPENALARRFREAHGRMNQAIADRADWVAFVAAGLPLWLKGGA